MKTIIIVTIIAVLGIALGIYGLATIETCFEDGYSISVFGADRYAGTDYDKALEMANGNPVYVVNKHIKCN